jgi:ribosomal protein L6P/L9E
MEEVGKVEVEEAKEGVKVVGTKAWNRTHAAISELHDKVKDIKVTKPGGKLVGKIAATLARPITNFVSGVKEGWKE